MAIAIVAVNPGKEPTSIPNKIPPQIMRRDPQFKIKCNPLIIS
jgi:hypothetical protein